MKKYTFEYTIRLDDLDYMGLVGNANWLIILERARIELLDQIQYPFSKMLKNKIGGVVAEAKVKFLKPAFFNDKLTVNIQAHSPFSKGFILNYIVNNQNGTECLSADITMIFVDQSGKSIPTPEELTMQLFDQ